MKNLILNRWQFAVVLGLLCFACEEKSEELQVEDEVQEVNTVPDKDAEYVDTISQDSYEVAVIQKDGHEYHFIALGDEDEMMVLETLYGDALKNSEKSSHDIDRSPFDLFVSLTEKGVAVPDRIAKTASDTERIKSDRKIGTSGGLLEIKDPSYVEPFVNKACYDVGSTNFRNTYCGGTPVQSKPGDIRYCDNGLWNSLTRSSIFGGDWKELDDVYTWTNVVCGMTRVQFYAWENTSIWPFSNWKWVLKYQVDFTNGIWYAYQYTSTNTERQVKRTRPSNTGSFRAYTRFF